MRVLGVLLLVLIAASCRSKPERMKFRKQTLTRLAPGYAPRTVTATDDGAQYGYIRGTKDPMHVVWNGKAQPDYALCRGPWFSPSGSRFVYFGADADRVFVVVDGAPYEIGFMRRDFLAFSTGSPRWATVSGPQRRPDEPCPAERALITVDGAIVGTYADASLPALSNDGHHVAYLTTDAGGTLSVILDGQTQRQFERPSEACFGLIPPQDDGPWLLRQAHVRFLSDGRLLTVLYDQDGWAVYRDNERLASYDVNLPGRNAALPISIEAPVCMRKSAILANWLVTARDAPVAVWWERREVAPDSLETHWRVVRDGQPIDDQTCRRPFDEELLTVTPDGQHVPYACLQEGDALHEALLVVAGANRYGPYRSAWAITPSDDGRRTAYGANETDAIDGWRVYVDGRPTKQSYFGTWRPRFSPSGKHVAWQGQTDRRSAGALGIDRVELTRFNELVAGPTFTSDRTVTWIIRRNARIVRLQVELPESTPAP